MNIEIIAGSPRQGSVTYRVALFLQHLLQHTTNYNVQIIDVREWEFPLMQQEVFSASDQGPAALQPLIKRVFAANAFIIITPEYNGSYTPAVKVLFDHFPKQHHKAFGIVTASTGTLGGIRASQQLQLLINALFGIGSPYMLVTPFVDKKFDETGTLTDAAFQKSVDVFVKEFLWLAESLTPLLQIKE
ncbi:NAD(P)H-dependent FMN reductase [Filimonas lacunae]|uniref:NAD(P)H-dependent FMN reductase n=1 Tax=Filimonas lacunae TaxID=477680 RepID=A0A173MNZ7_9BACT|nr:NAD(P)H-dependent oxidoreductase [Filimonas lacunae]BAV09373.1 reductase homolog [Filimonas lacunae]SIS71981.1 NAD(P)H-dependent FMN reductase [Filimonas lacunae]